MIVIKVRGVIQPFSLDVNGGEMKIVFPSMPKGAIASNMALMSIYVCR